MSEERIYRKVHPSKSQAVKAAADYATGKYENKHAAGSIEYEEYHAAYHDLVLDEPIEGEEA